MKHIKQPKLNLTQITLQDASTYNLKWIFFKPKLNTEVDFIKHPVWIKKLKKINKFL